MSVPVNPQRVSSRDMSSAFRGLCRLAPGRPVRQLDVLFVDRLDAFACAMLAYTGDRAWTIALRRAARARGLALSERGLAPLATESQESRPRGQDPDCPKTERGVFAALGVAYVPPSGRVAAA